VKEKARHLIVYGLMIFPILAFVFIETQEWMLQNRVKSYLTEERGYHSEDIKQITTRTRKRVTEAVVIFVDEPEIEYRYNFQKGTIQQMGYGLVQGFSKEIDQSNLEHLE